MSESTRIQLRRTLVDGYGQLKRRLTQRLGSSTLASEALNETWMRLGRGGELGSVTNAEAYVYRAALNTAANLIKAESRHAGHAVLADIPEIEDEAPRSDRVAASRDEVEQVVAALAELPQRQRDAFVECFRGETMPEILAERYGVSVRTIQADIRNAILHCAERLDRKDVLVGRRVKLSKE